MLALFQSEVALTEPRKTTVQFETAFRKIAPVLVSANLEELEETGRVEIRPLGGAEAASLEEALVDLGGRERITIFESDEIGRGQGLVRATVEFIDIAQALVVPAEFVVVDGFAVLIEDELADFLVGVFGKPVIHFGELLWR